MEHLPRIRYVAALVLLSRLGETPENLTGRILFISMFNDISCGTKDNEKECLANARLVSLYARIFGKGQWSFIGPGSEKKWYSMKEDSPQGIWDNLAEKMLIEFAESGCPIFRATTPLSRGQLRSEGHGKLSIHFAATQKTIETIFRIIVCANQLSLYGAVAEMCEEFETVHDRSGRPDMVMGQSIVLSAIKTEVSLDCYDPTNQNLLLQQYGERIEKLSQQEKLRKFCMDAGFLNVVEIGQCFMTDTGDLTQFHAVACREYTLPREDGSSQPRGWIQGNTKIGLLLEVTTSCLHGKHGVEIRIWSLNGDNTHSWVRISHGSKKICDGFEQQRQKFLKISSKNMRYNRMRNILYADQMQKQNHKEENLLALHHESFPWKEGLGLILNQGNILSLRTKFRRK